MMSSLPNNRKHRASTGSDHKDFQIPGKRDIAEEVMKCHKYRTISDHDSDREEIYEYSNGIYERCESWLKADIQQVFLSMHNNLQESVATELDDVKSSRDSDSKKVKYLEKVAATCDTKMREGPSTHLVNEVMNIIRRDTFTDPSLMNPSSHIPFRNGFLNIKMWKLEPFNSDLLFTWKVEASYLEEMGNSISLRDCPHYMNSLLSVYHPIDIPQVLEYNGYTLYPLFPTSKTDFRVGPEGIGKGVEARILESLLGAAYGTVDLNKLLTQDRFQFSGLKGHNLLVDAEINTKFRRGKGRSWRNFNNLFGKDTINNEEKFKEARNDRPVSKGIFLGNPPLFPNDNRASLRRMLLKQTKAGRATKDITDLHEIILQHERDKIATLYIKYLRILERNEWVFVNELTVDSTQRLWDQLVDPIGNFMDECMFWQDGVETKVDDAYERFDRWCKDKGIPTAKSQTFKKRVGELYEKKNRGPSTNRYYVFTNCSIEEVIPLQTQSKLNTLEVDKKTSNTTFSRNYRYGVQLEYNPLPCERKREGEGNVSKEKVPKLNTVSSAEGNAETNAPASDTGVFKFRGNPDLYSYFADRIKDLNEIDLSTITLPEEFEYVDWNEKLTAFMQAGINNGFRLEGSILRKQQHE